MVNTLRGYALVTVLVAVAICSAGAATVFQLQNTRLAKLKELETIWIIQTYRDAFQSFYNAAPEGIRRPPSNVDELLLDTRFVTTRRHLRSAYVRPDTNQFDWDWVAIIVTTKN